MHKHKKNRSFPFIYFTGTLLATASFLPIAVKVDSVFAAPVQAKSADSFVDSIGVNTHLTYGDTPYENFEKIKNALKDAGIRHIRDGGHNEDDYINKLLELAKSGIKSNLIFQGTPPAIVLEVLKKAKGAVSAAEGPNESDLDQFNFAYKGEKFPQGTRNYQKELQAAIESDAATKNIPLILPSMGWGENADKQGQIGELGDYCNMHSYPNSGKKPTYDIDWYFIKHAKNMCGENKPLMVTETGYNNAVNDTEDGSGISETASGKYIPRMLFENFNRNIKRTFLYELIDESKEGDKESNFGLLRNDGSAKPAYTAIKNINALFKDKGNFQPGSLDYNLSGDKDIHSTLLQKSDGTFYLVLWQDAESYDVDNNKDIQVAGKKVKISLTNPVTGKLHDPLKLTAPKTFGGTKVLEVQVLDYPIIVEIAAQGNTQRNTPSTNTSPISKPTEANSSDSSNKQEPSSDKQSSSPNQQQLNTQEQQTEEVESPEQSSQQTEEVESPEQSSQQTEEVEE